MTKIKILQRLSKTCSYDRTEPVEFCPCIWKLSSKAHHASPMSYVNAVKRRSSLAWNDNTMMENLERSGKNRGGFILSTITGCTNTIHNIPCITASANMYTDNVGNNSCPLLLRPNHKSLAILKTLSDKYSKSYDLVFDPFAVSLSTEHICMLVWQNRGCAISDVSSECFKHGFLQLVEVLVRQMGNPESGISGSAEFEKAAALFVQTLQSIRAQHFNNN